MTPTRTFVEMRDASALRAAAAAPPAARIEEVSGCPASFWRYLYTEVGRAYQWTDRLVWTDDDVRAYLDDPTRLPVPPDNLGGAGRIFRASPGR